MNITFEEYLDDTKRHLLYYQKEEDKNDTTLIFSLYDYKYEKILDNKEYFRKCMEDGLSAYKALLFFEDYLEQKILIYEKQIKRNYN